LSGAHDEPAARQQFDHFVGVDEPAAEELSDEVQA